jgi:hypothetical protein
MQFFPNYLITLTCHLAICIYIIYIYDKEDFRSVVTTLVHASVLAFTDATLKKGAPVFAETSFDEHMLTYADVC